MTNSSALAASQDEEFLAPASLGVEPHGIPRGVTRHLVQGSSALGVAIAIERGLGFLANILASRMGGVATFGAYSLAISTANNISTYAAGGIGSTAARFSGKYPYGSSGYGTLARVLIVVSLVSAGVAASGLWLGAAPIAHLLHNPALSGLLRWTAISAAGFILLECARGFYIGQRRLVALLLLSSLVGAGLLVLIPLAARVHNPVRMIVLQGVVTTSAVLVSCALARSIGLLAPSAHPAPAPLAPMLREVWSFGFVQLAGLIGVNLAGWWLTTLVARADTTLVQMSFFAIASQLRNIASLAPSLLTESSYAVMVEPEDGVSSTPQHVMALCTYAATVATVVLSAAGILIAPWALHWVYGASYTPASLAVMIAFAVAVVHMGNAPAAARLSIVSIRLLGSINTLWAIFVAGAATLFLLHGGTAWRAMTIYLAGHIFSAVLVLFALARRDRVPDGMIATYTLGSVTALALATLAWLRLRQPSLALPLTAVILLLSAASLALLYRLGRRYRWLPTTAALRRLLASAVSSLGPLRRMLHPGARHAG